MHGILAGQGLERFYDLGGGRGQPIGAVPSPSRRDWLDELEQRAAAEDPADGDERIQLELDVQGIHCAACVWVLQELWRRRDGALRLDINPSLGRAKFVYDRGRLDLAGYLDDAERLGYRMAPASKDGGGAERGLLVRMGICIALALNAMMFALSGYLGLGSGGVDDGGLAPLFHGLSLALAAVAVAVGGPVFFRAAWAGVRRGVLHLDLPISLGILLAFGGSLAVYATGGGETYFDTVTIFVALMLVGRYLQVRAVRRNRDYLLANDGAEHLRARVLRDGQVSSVPIRDLAVGDELLLAPGDLVPARARLRAERAWFSLDWIRGESERVSFTQGAVVPAGAFCANPGAVRAEVLADPAASGLLDLLAVPQDGPEDGMRGRGGFWTWLNRAYVGLVLGFAALACGVWLWLDPSRALDVTTSVLVVTCPCALGLAIPLAFELAVAGLRRRGIFVRKMQLLDKARHVRTVVFDKTGTLTWGGMRAAPLRAVPAAERDVMLTMVSGSSHPVSRAIAETERTRAFAFLDELQVEECVGRGLRARHGHAEYRLGCRSFVLGDAAREESDGLVVFARDGQVLACYQLEEDLRDGYGDELAALRAAGFDVALLSGDRADKVARVAESLGLPPERALAEMSPQDKAAWIAATDRGDTMMVGDGLNDAPAFEAAFCAGTPALDRPVLPSRADFFFTGGGAGAVSRVLGAGRRFHRVVSANLWLAGVYNAAALTLCFAGAMTPLLCAVLMPLSSLALIGHTSLRLRGEAAP